jgi:hypothetical protein
MLLRCAIRIQGSTGSSERKNTNLSQRSTHLLEYEEAFTGRTTPSLKPGHTRIALVLSTLNGSRAQITKESQSIGQGLSLVRPRRRKNQSEDRVGQGDTTASPRRHQNH